MAIAAAFKGLCNIFLMIKQEILDILACPKCKGDLNYERDALLCHACRLKFAVENDVPNMLMEDARKF